MIDQAKLDEAKAAAEECEKSTGCPSLLTLAQWALESNWGENQPGNNCFGIKEYHGCYGTQTLEIEEIVRMVRFHVGENFATFPDLKACFEYHANQLITGQFYKSAWIWYRKTQDVFALAADIMATYSTDANYGHKVIALMKSISFQEYV